MQRLYTTFDTIFLGHLCNLLLSQGVQAEIRNQYSIGGFGELPATECMPELWVERMKYVYAADILKESLNEQTNDYAEPWVCPGCHEKIDGQFSQCWKCLTVIGSVSK